MSLPSESSRNQKLRDLRKRLDLVDRTIKLLEKLKHDATAECPMDSSSSELRRAASRKRGVLVMFPGPDPAVPFHSKER